MASSGQPARVGVRQATPDHRPGLAIMMMLASMLAFASMDGLSKLLVQHLAIPQILWVRYILFTFFVAVLLRRQGLRSALQTGQPLLQAFRALLIIVENGLFVLAFLYMPLADVHAIAAVSPLVVVALSVPLLGEKVGARRWLAVIAGFVGVLVIVRPGFVKMEWPVAIPLCAARVGGLYQVLVRMCARTDSGETTWAWSAVVGLVATTLVGPFVWVWPDARGWGLLVAIAILGSAAHFSLIKALEYWEAGALQPYSYTLLVWATVIGFLVFGQVPDGWTLAGAAIVIASGLYVWHRERSIAQRLERTAL
ncbi:MAG: DMT family transporter [Hyphomicrobiaceae bacterium]